MRILPLIFLFLTSAIVVSSQNTGKAWQKNIEPLTDTIGQNGYGGIYPVDVNRNIVTGTYDADVFISCVDSTGAVQWRTVFGGSSLGSDGIGGVFIAPTGLIYVTGYLDNEVGQWDLFVKCFTPSGTELFSYEREGGVLERDAGTSIVVNNNGTIFVSGYLRTAPSLKTAYLGCLDNTGNLQWEILTSGSAVGDCSYNDLLIYNNQLFLTGSVTNNVTNSDAILEARSFSGTLNWTHVYDNGNTNGSYSLIKEYNGNLYVCGSAPGGIVTRISPSGTVAWSTVVVSSSNIAFQSDGDIIVCGAAQVSSNLEIRVYCLRDTGSIRWTYTYVPTPYNGADYPSALAIAPNDEIYLTGRQAMSSINSDQLLMKISAAGTLVWTRRRNGTFAGFNTEYAAGMRLYAGRIMTAGMLHNAVTGEDGSLSAYNHAGTSLFLQQLNRGHGYTRHVQMQHTPSGTIIAAVAADTNSIVLEEYSQGGATLQRDTIHCPGTGMPWLKTMKTDAFGNVYLGAQFNGVANNYDIWLAKLNPSLDTIWTEVYSGPSVGSDDVTDLAIDAGGNIYVAGAGTLSSGTGLFVLKYSPAGVLNDSGLLNGTNGSGSPHELLITSLGEMYMLASLNNLTTGNDVSLIKINSSCDSIWSRSLTSAVAVSNDIPGSMHEYSNGDIGVTGSSFITFSQADVLAARFDSNGNRLWQSVLSDPQLPDYNRAVAGVMHNDTLYLTGTAGGSNYLTVAMGPSGTIMWWQLYENGEAQDIAFDSFSRSICLTGSGRNGSGTDDIAVLRYDVTGALIDSTFEWAYYSQDAGVSIMSFTNDGSVYVAADLGTGNMARIIKYCIGGAANAQTISTALLCAGDSVQLNAPAGYQYLWSPAAFISNDTVQNPLVYPSSNTTYTLTLSTTYGCSAAHYYNVNMAPATQLQLAFQAASVCFGDSVQLQANGLSAYSWSPALYLSDTALANPMAYGVDTIMYVVSGPDLFGCTTHTDSVEVVVNPLPAVTFSLTLPDTVCSTPATMLLGGGSPAGGQYSGTGVSGGNFQPALADSGFNVVVYTYTDPTTGCSSFEMDSIYVDVCMHVNEISEHEFSVYPVPASGYVVIQSPTALIAQVEIINLQGAVLLTTAQPDGASSFTINVNDLARGIYFARVSSPSGTALLRFSVL